MSLNQKNLHVHLLEGLSPYPETWEQQQLLVNEIIDRKVANRQREKDGQPIEPVEHHLMLVEHPHVYTLGRSGSMDNLLLDEAGLQMHQATFHKINRGGDITYHGPGQLVVYPLFDLDDIFTDVGRFVRTVEEAGILLCADYGLEAGRIEGKSGTWIDWGKPSARKIMAVGIHLSRWCTMHGVAFNVNTDLSYFGHIIPCGIQEFGVTSLEKELGRKVDFSEARERMLGHYRQLFGF